MVTIREERGGRGCKERCGMQEMVFCGKNVRVKGKTNKKIPQENSREKKLLSEVRRQLNK